MRRRAVCARRRRRSRWPNVCNRRSRCCGWRATRARFGRRCRRRAVCAGRGWRRRCAACSRRGRREGFGGMDRGRAAVLQRQQRQPDDGVGRARQPVIQALARATTALQLRRSFCTGSTNLAAFALRYLAALNTSTRLMALRHGMAGSWRLTPGVAEVHEGTV